MRIFLLLILVLSTNTAFAEETIHTIIKKNRHYTASWWEKSLRLNNDFPQKKYETDAVRLVNPLFNKRLKNTSSNKTIQDYDLILIKLRLQLISYNEKTSTYKFVLSAPDIMLNNHGRYKHIEGEVYFDNYADQKILLAGKFKEMPKSGAYPMPKINESDKNNFILSLDEIKDITISTQHNIPITIKLYD